MGDRSSIVVRSQFMPTPVQIYGHWSGTANVKAVEAVFALDATLDDTVLVVRLLDAFAKASGEHLATSNNFAVTPVALGESEAIWSDDNPVVYVDADEYSAGYMGEVYTREQVGYGALTLAAQGWFSEL